MNHDHFDKDTFFFFFRINSVYSQFYPCEFQEDGRVFSLAEQYMQFHKAGNNFITKTSPCNEQPLLPHFYIVKLRFTGVYVFLIFCSKT